MPDRPDLPEVVRRLIDPAHLVEIEVDAVIDEGQSL